MQDEFLSWCDQHIADCMAQQRALIADERKDEANFMQIRANVYGIFRSVCTALKGDMAQLNQRLMSIPAAWKKNLHRAEAHGDDAKAHIERIKLETVQTITDYLTHLEAQHND